VAPTVFARKGTVSVSVEAADWSGVLAWAFEDSGLAEAAVVGHARRATAGLAPKPPGLGAGQPARIVTVVLLVMPLVLSVAVRVWSPRVTSVTPPGKLTRPWSPGWKV
jgi:hypothetical protein